MVRKKDLENLLRDGIGGLRKASNKDRLYLSVTPIWNKEMGQRLRLMRESLLMDQSAFGLRLGISQSLVSDIERGKIQVAKGLTLARLEAALPKDALGFVLHNSAPERYSADYIKRRYYQTKFAPCGPPSDRPRKTRYGVGRG